MSDLDQTVDTPLQEPLFPTRDGRSRRSKPFLDGSIRQTLGKQENQTMSKYIASRERARLRSLLHLIRSSVVNLITSAAKGISHETPENANCS